MNTTTELSRVLSENYFDLRKKYFGNADLQKITKHGNSREDSFHNAILTILTKQFAFNYESDEKTLNYIKYQLFKSTRIELTYLYRDKKVFIPIPDNADNLQGEEEANPITQTRRSASNI